MGIGDGETPNMQNFGKSIYPVRSLSTTNRGYIKARGNAVRTLGSEGTEGGKVAGDGEDIVLEPPQGDLVAELLSLSPLTTTPVAGTSPHCLARRIVAIMVNLERWTEARGGRVLWGD